MDATLAALFCNGVVNMQSMGLGGGFFMTVYINETKEAVVLNAREKAPLNSSINMFNGDSQKSKVGKFKMIRIVLYKFDLFGPLHGFY